MFYDGDNADIVTVKLTGFDRAILRAGLLARGDMRWHTDQAEKYIANVLPEYPQIESVQVELAKVSFYCVVRFALKLKSSPNILTISI